METGTPATATFAAWWARELIAGLSTLAKIQTRKRGLRTSGTTPVVGGRVCPCYERSAINARRGRYVAQQPHDRPTTDARRDRHRANGPVTSPVLLASASTKILTMPGVMRDSAVITTGEPETGRSLRRMVTPATGHAA